MYHTQFAVEMVEAKQYEGLLLCEVQEHQPNRIALGRVGMTGTAQINMHKC
jgi:hypothetical protein